MLFERSHGPTFSIRSEPLDHGVCLHVTGEMDLATVPALDSQLSALRTAFMPVILDLSEVTFFDSTGLRSMVRATRAARLRPCKFLISQPSDAVMRVVDIAGLRDLLPLLETETPAEQSGRGPV
ncbi:MAG: STAS domain-containing protein [Thermoleophilaceae bacterium]